MPRNLRLSLGLLATLFCAGCDADSPKKSPKKTGKESADTPLPRWLQTSWERARKAVREGHWSSGISFCDISTARPPGAKHQPLTAWCQALPKRAVTDLTRRLIAKRDAGKAGHSECMALRIAAAKLGRSHEQVAEKRCAEGLLAHMLKGLFMFVEASARRKPPWWSNLCKLDPRDIEKLRIGTPYAKKQWQKLRHLCFEIGAVSTLRERFKLAPNDCPPEGASMLEAVRRLQPMKLRIPAPLAPLLAQLRRVCRAR